MKFLLNCINLPIVFLLAAMPADSQQPARVDSFTPQGTVKQVRQVSARFSEAMIPFGDPRVSVQPFVIDCSEPGTGRWVDSRNYVYDFSRDLEAGTRCEFRLREGLKSLAGNDVTGQRAFTFTTGGPAIIHSMPFEGTQIEEDQAFRLQLDGEATDETVLKNVYFSVEGISDRIGIRLLAAREREPVIRSAYRYDRELLREALEKPRKFPVIQAKQRFPAEAKVSLVWGKGVAAPGGVTTDDDQVLPFIVRAPFTASVHCSRENPAADCVPITPLRVSFSASIPQGVARKIVLKDSGGRRWAPIIEGDETDDDRFVYGASFKGPFPEKSSLTVELPPGIRDDSGRALSNADKFPMVIKTDEYPPLAKFAADFGILELNADPMLPVTLRNVEPEVSARTVDVTGGDAGAEPPAYLQEGQPGVAGNMTGRVFKVPSDSASRMWNWIAAVKERNWEDREKSILGHLSAEKIKKISIPKLQGAKSFEVVGIPLQAPGFYVVEIESELLGAALLGVSKPMFVPTTVLVTNLSVHFKWSEEVSLVWVTTLDAAKPVPDAALQIRDCEGTILWEGKTDKDGLAKMSGLPSENSVSQCRNRTQDGLLVTARLGDDLAFVHSSWNEGIEPWRFQIPVEPNYRPEITRTILDRSLFRAGETVHMKHIARRHGTSGFSIPGPSGMGDRLVIQHVGSEQQYELPLKWDAKGIAESTWTIPKEAKLGEYLVAPAAPGGGLNLGDPSAEFRVEEFRVPLMKGIIRPPSETLVAPSSVPVDLTVNYLAGGGAGSLPVRFRYGVQARGSAPPDGRENFMFSAGRLKEGIVRGDTEPEEETRLQITRTDLTLDRNGSARATIAKLPRIDKPMEIQAELEFRDPNGEIQTVSSQIPLWPASRQIGIKVEGWAVSKENLKSQVAVVDLAGKPVADAPVKVDLFQIKTYSHRKRLIGGFYAYEHSTETRRMATLCEGKTDSRGLLFCERPPSVSGSVALQATSRDEAGHEIATNINLWVAGSSEWWFRAEEGDRIDLIPERKRYEPGETAKFQVRMPFRNATALVSIEREGVGETFVRELSGKEPVVEVPILGNYAPNVFVSALVVRGRVAETQPTATVDLGRPAYKLGIAEINVGWSAHELKVRLTPEKQVYKVREKAKVAVSVNLPDGTPPPRGTEIALAAVDEGLLELMPNKSWQLLEEMMGRRSDGVRTATAQMNVIGKRHFGLKALPQGGGGGRQTTRELFDTLLFWKGRIQLDPVGKTTVEIPLNDSLTSFRIVAIANSGPDRFGTGSTSIRSTQDLIIFSSIPPVVRQGDKIRPEFTLRNATGQPMDVNVSVKVKEISEPLPPAAVSVPAGESRIVGWNIEAPTGVDSLHYELEAATAGGEGDRLSVAEKVVPAVPVRTFQATLAQVEGELRVDVERPKDATAGLGGIQVTLRRSLLEGLTGVTEYISKYPYSCLEQDISKAVALRDPSMWERIMKRLPTYLDGDGLAKYWPAMHLGSDALTSYALSIAHEAGWTIPEDPRQRMLTGLRGFVEGKVIRYSTLPTADLSIRKLAAVEAISRYDSPVQASGNARRVVPGAPATPFAGVGNGDANLLASITLEPNLWPTSAVLDWINILDRWPNLRNGDRRLAEAEQILRARLNLQGTRMGFSTDSSDFLWWLMISGDTNAIRLLLTELNSPAWKEDIPRIVRGALGRQRQGHWDTTVANAWGVLAMEKFSRSFETTPVTGTARASVAGSTKSLDWGTTPKGGALLFDWPPQQDSLMVGNNGTGKPWATVQSLAAIPLKEPVFTGFKIKRTVIPVEQKEPNVWSRGDILRVRLELESQAEMTWVVVSDPVPAGASILGTGLGRDSQLATSGEERKGWAWPIFEERSLEAYRAYYEFVPKGTWTIEYTLRLNAVGTMNLPPTRVEAMYSPEMFGEIPNAPVRVR